MDFVSSTQFGSSRPKKRRIWLRCALDELGKAPRRKPISVEPRPSEQERKTPSNSIEVTASKA